MSSRRKRSPEEQARREKIRELLQSSGISSMEDIQNLFKETIAEFMENGLDAELDDELGYSRYQTTAVTVTAAKRCAPASAMLKCQCLVIGKVNLSRSF